MSLLTSIEAIQLFITKRVFAITPEGKGSNLWQHHEGPSLIQELDTLRGRLFAVEFNDEQTEQLLTTGDNTTDYMVFLNVTIAYEKRDNHRLQALSDFNEIKYDLITADISSLVDLNFFQIFEFSFEESENENYEFLLVPVLCRVTIDN